MKIAIAHDYLVNKGGAERTVLALHRMWPDAPIYTSLYHPDTTYEAFAGADVRTSSLQRYSRDPESFRRFLPLFGRALRRMPIEGFDIVVSSSTGFAHQVQPASGCHLVYCHAPPRFLWDERYEHGTVAPLWARPALPLVLAALRRADRRAAARAHLYVSNSLRTADRVLKVYGRRSVIVHPPVEVQRFRIGPRTGDYHMMVGRLLPHRNMHLAVEAFTRMQRRLVVVGDGPARADLERIAGPTIEFRGAVDDATLAQLYGMSRGLVFPGEEDFGIVPLEANASGRPVIAFGRGGARETVREGVTGVLFTRETADAIVEAVERAESITFDPAVLRTHAERFSEAEFARRIGGIVEGQLESCIECARGKRSDNTVRFPRRGDGRRGATEQPPEPPDAGAI